MKRRVLMKPAEVAELLGVTVGTLARWRVKGIGPNHVKVGGGIRYDAVDVETEIAARKRCSTCDLPREDRTTNRTEGRAGTAAH